MSKHDQGYSNNTTTSPALVSVISCGHENITQTYPNIEHINFNNLKPQKAFNKGIESSQGVVLCFLDQYSNFASDNVIKQMIDIFRQHREFAAIYSDNITNNYRQYYPSFSQNLIKNVIIDTPFCCKKEVPLTLSFNPNMQMYYYDVIRKLSQTTILHHIPHPLFFR